MQTQKPAIRFVLFVVVILAILLFLISVMLMVPGRYTDQLLQQIENQTGVEVLSVEKEYSFLSGKFLLTRPELRISPGITLKSESMAVNVAWTSLWKETIELDRIDFKKPGIFIDLAIIGQKPPMPNLYQFLRETEQFVFEDGSMKVVNTEQTGSSKVVSIDFSKMELKTHRPDQIDVEVVRESSHIKWSLGGIIDLKKLALSGQLSIDELPLADVVSQNFLKCSNCSLEGRLSTDLSVEWSGDQGVELTGTAKVLDGEYHDLSSGLELSWKELFAEGFQFRCRKGSVEDLSFRGGLLTVKGSPLEQIAKTLNRSLPTDGSVPFTLKNIEFNGAIQSSQKQNRKLFSNSRVELAVMSPEQYTFQLAGQWLERVPVSLKGSVDLKNAVTSRLNVTARDVDLSLLPVSERSVAGYDLAGSRVNLNLVSSAGGGSKGKLTFSKLVGRPVEPELDINHVKALMANPQSIISIDVTDRDGLSPQVAAGTATREAWESVLEQPLQYLSNQAGIKPILSGDIQMPSGKAVLTEYDKTQLKGWGRVLRIRPELGLSLKAVASKNQDWPSLSRAELESNLAELYSAIHQTKPGEVKEIPADVRGHLIEQMYLRAHNRTLPEVGDASQSKRIKEAEQWLLVNWPANQEKMNKLATDRLNLVYDFLRSEGVSEKRIISSPPSTVEQAGSAIEVQLSY
ncbi:hypothetical protein [Endozoicomonas sp. 8E]|uniref:hypothetical protein n=1 Tax=Endozoicomonas sp. 8E TaxID=3035692 RepID=UPI0029391FAA|nr:hypothetical protein [Endozoicomonas sp. 8E]WOG26136.1 hypothetical protein P6910_16385 [Endozoicomonas sp. 8E]